MAAALPAGCEFPPSNVYPYNAPGDPRQFAVGEQVCVQDGSAAPYVGTFNSWTQQGPTNRTTIRVNGPAAGQVRTVSWMHVGKMNGPPTVWPPTLFTHGAPPVYQGGVWGPEGPYPQFPYPPGTGNPTAPGQYVPPPAGVPLAMAPAVAPALPPIFVGDAYGNPLAAHHLLGAHYGGPLWPPPAPAPALGAAVAPPKPWPQRNIPANTDDPVNYATITNGMDMVDFHGEFGFGRYYPLDVYNLLNPRLNPVTRQPILPGDVTFYTARVPESGGRRRRTRKHRRSRGRKTRSRRY